MLCTDNSVVLILNFFKLPSIDTKLFKTLLNEKRFLKSSEKTLQERRLTISKISQDNSKNLFDFIKVFS